jgi:hypothetical protein
MFALWRRLDVPGHDFARLVRLEDGWSIEGCALFSDAEGPACLHYMLELDSTWRSRLGTIHGFAGERRIDHRIERDGAGWRLDGAPMPGLDHLQDLDYGFTPATNLPQLRRLALQPGEAADLRVAWFDIGGAGLVELPQRYERRGETHYWYESPSGPYQAMLEIAAGGFVTLYPGLWMLEAQACAMICAS